MYIPNKLAFAVLPSQDEIMRRLTNHLDEPNLVKRFYPLIAQNAGQEKFGPGIVIMLYLAIQDFISTGGYPEIMNAILILNIPDYIHALVDDPQVVEDAMNYYRIIVPDKENHGTTPDHR